MRKRNKKRVPRIWDAVIACGVVLLLTPLFLSLRMSFLQSREAAASKAPPSVPGPRLPTSEGRVPPALSTTPPAQREIRTSIIIPKLKLDAVVVEEVTESDLDKGPMRLKGTGVPGSGNCCIAAHKEKWFRGLSRLNPGDSVILNSSGDRYIYIVTRRSIVHARDLWVLEDTTEPTITLITCSKPAYFGRGNSRLIVTGELDTVK